MTDLFAFFRGGAGAKKRKPAADYELIELENLGGTIDTVYLLSLIHI